MVPKKGARIVWTNDGEFLVVTGFSKQSERTISVYRFYIELTSTFIFFHFL